MGKVLILVLFIFVSFWGCSPRYDFKRHHIVKQEYVNKPIYLSDYILCVGLRNTYNVYSLISSLHKFEEFGILFNHDSIFNHFQKSINRLNLNLIDSIPSINHCDSIYYKNYRMKIGELNTEAIKSMGQHRGLRLIPIIYLDNHYLIHSFVGSSGTFGGGYYIKQTILRVLILVIDGDEIIYLRSAQHFGKAYPSIDEKEKRTNIEQKHWDNIVALAMRDYIKGMK